MAKDLHQELRQYQHQASTHQHSSSPWIRLVVAPLLLILAAAASSHAEAPSKIAASLRADSRNGKWLRTPQEQQNSHPANEKRRRRRRRAQDDGDGVPTLDDLLVNAIDGTTPKLCTLKDNGLYGDPIGGNNVAVVEYLYQLSVVPGTTASQLKAVILPELDAAIPTAVLPVFFPAECSSSTTAINNGGGAARRQRHQRQLQGGTVQAISMMPEDELVMNGCKYFLM